MPDGKEKEFLELKATFFLMVLKMAKKIGLSIDDLENMFSKNMLKRAYNHIEATGADKT